MAEIPELTDHEKTLIICNGHPAAYCNIDCIHCPKWLLNICENYDEYATQIEKEKVIKHEDY